MLNSLADIFIDKFLPALPSKDENFILNKDNNFIDDDLLQNIQVKLGVSTLTYNATSLEQIKSFAKYLDPNDIFGSKEISGTNPQVVDVRNTSFAARNKSLII